MHEAQNLSQEPRFAPYRPPSGLGPYEAFAKDAIKDSEPEVETLASADLAQSGIRERNVTESEAPTERPTEPAPAPEMPGYEHGITEPAPAPVPDEDAPEPEVYSDPYHASPTMPSPGHKGSN